MLSPLHRARRLVLASLCLLALPAGAIAAQRPGGPGAAPTGVDISPDGTTIAWTIRGREDSALHLTSVADRDAAKEKLITVNGATNCSNTSPLWSPDGQTLAFTSTCTASTTTSVPTRNDQPQAQIFLWSKATGAVRQLTHVTGLFKQAAWSPDGKSIAFLFVENATRSAGALDAMKPWSGVIGEDGVEVQRVYAVDAGTGLGNWLTPANLHVFEFDWAPKPFTDIYDIAYIAAAPPGENNWWVAKLYGQTLGDTLACLDRSRTCAYNGRLNSGPKVVLDPARTPGPLHGLQIAVPRWSPDGKRIALIGGLMSDQGSTGGDIWVVDADGKSAPTDITPGIDGTPNYEGWLSNDKIGFVEDRRGHTLLTDYNVADRALVPNSTDDLGEVTISGGAIKDAVAYSDNGILAFVKTGAALPPEIWAGPGDNIQQITHLNSGATPGPKFESLEWQDDGFHVQGWLTYPKDYDSAKKYPLIVEVHGGPSASSGPRPVTMWSDLGYFVLAPNPRGSFGQGEAFVQANRKDFGYGDLRDILKGMDTVEAKVSIDKDREGLTGWSYGGFMTMFAVTQTHRFRAAVAGAGISDWESYYGENSIDQWMVPFFGATVYDDPAVYAKSSAITFIKNAKTPMLIIVGDRDGECPAPQSFEMWHALRAEGVTTQLVIYPNEGHGFRNPEHIRDRNEREIAWFAKYMPAPSQQQAVNSK
jgi:dipeptidyl aminopeptidase/acylaminoacyl peptidase